MLQILLLSEIKVKIKNMNTMYLLIVGFLFLLAIFDLWVGVSNDAVNFLNSSIGSKAAKFKTILIVAAFGILCGAVMSNGMMDIARHGIFQPSQFTFHEVMCIFTAMMITDIVLLDIFNSLGLPTSTTVSMVFELLGGAFVLSIIKIIGDSTGALSLGDLLNSEKALTVILSIFLSVAIAFFFGIIVQWISRIIFSFNYIKTRNRFAGLFGGISATALFYFILVKGLEGSPYIPAEWMTWMNSNLTMIMISAFVILTVIMQVLTWLRFNIFRFIVLLGTFALAMAFAGNDLVNFIGVPLAGYSSFLDYTAAGATNPDTFMMDFTRKFGQNAVPLPFHRRSYHDLFIVHQQKGAARNTDGSRTFPSG
jgi:phosphate/sulfate permease